ncbi:MAG: ABC transporter permease, partial [Chloroflexota bacterium]|nr:ABC transporter permease [Chloroflexota bacterium]
MRPTKLIKIAWGALVKNKIRSLLTMLGIIIGVAAVIIMIAISAGTEATIKDEITSLGSNLIFVTGNFSRMSPGGGGGSSSSGGLVYEDAFAIQEEIAGVNGVVVEAGATESVKASGANLDGVSILGTTADFPSVRDIDVEQG